MIYKIEVREYLDDFQLVGEILGCSGDHVRNVLAGRRPPISAIIALVKRIIEARETITNRIGPSLIPSNCITLNSFTP